jgi:hypothetical protein
MRARARGGRVDTVGYKLAEGKGLREGWDSKELWKYVEKSQAPFGFAHHRLVSRGAKDE